MKNCSKHELRTMWTRFQFQDPKYLSHLECKNCEKKLSAVNVIKIFSTILEERKEMINDLIE